MGKKWQTTKIEDIAKSLAMGPFGSDIKTDNFVPSGVPIIRGSNFTSGRFTSGEFVYLTESKADELRAANAYPDDIVFTHRGTLGQVGIVPKEPFPRYVVSQSQMRLTCKRDLAEPLFVYYFFRSPQGQYALLMNTSQTGVPAISRPLTSLRQIDIPLPLLPEQKAIADILGSLDDKIELNRRTNETLEAMARAIFKSWFVDFDPVHAKSKGHQPDGMDAETARLFPSSFEESEIGLVPKGWRVQPLDAIANFLNGLACQKYPPTGDDSLPVIKIADLRNGVSDTTDRASPAVGADYIVKNGDVLFSWSGSLLVKIWTGGKGVLNQHLFKVTSDSFPRWFYYFWVREHLLEFQSIAQDKATTMGHIKRHHLTDAMVVVPDPEVLKKADAIIAPLVESCVQCDEESAMLSEARDALLPRLLSGEITVEKA